MVDLPPLASKMTSSSVEMETDRRQRRGGEGEGDDEQQEEKEEHYDPLRLPSVVESNNDNNINTNNRQSPMNDNNNNNPNQNDNNNNNNNGVAPPVETGKDVEAGDEQENDDEENDQDDYDDDDVSWDDENDPTTLHLRIKSTRDTNITVRSTDTVAVVKQAVLKSLHIADSQRYVRLILKGRLLAPDARPLGEFNVQTGDVVHAVLAAEGQRGGAQALLASAAAASAMVPDGLGGLHQRLLSSNNHTTTTTTGSGNGNRPAHHRLTRALLRGAGVTPTGLAMRWNHGPLDDPEDDSETSSLEEGQERLGFDRLRTPPSTSNNNHHHDPNAPRLSRAEVTAIRAYFSRHVDRWMRHHPDAAQQAMAGEADLVRRRLLLEDAWMQAQGPTSEFRLNLAGTLTPPAAAAASMRAVPWGNHPLSWRMAAGGQPPLLMNPPSLMMMTAATNHAAVIGTDRDFLWGFLFGFFVGFIMLLWVWMPTVPHKQKLGILTGISFQLALSMLQGSSGGGGGGDHGGDAVDDAFMGD